MFLTYVRRPINPAATASNLLTPTPIPPHPPPLAAAVTVSSSSFSWRPRPQRAGHGPRSKHGPPSNIVGPAKHLGSVPVLRGRVRALDPGGQVSRAVRSDQHQPRRLAKTITPVIAYSCSRGFCMGGSCKAVARLGHRVQNRDGLDLGVCQSPGPSFGRPIGPGMMRWVRRPWKAGAAASRRAGGAGEGEGGRITGVQVRLELPDHRGHSEHRRAEQSQRLAAAARPQQPLSENGDKMTRTEGA